MLELSSEEILEQPLEDTEDVVESEPEVPAPDTPSGDPDVEAQPSEPGQPSEDSGDAPSELDAAGELPPESAIVDQDMFQNTFDVGDGVKLTQLSREPLNMRVDGEWEPIQTAVDGVGFWSFLGFGAGEVSQHPLHPEFGRDRQR